MIHYATRLNSFLDIPGESLPSVMRTLRNIDGITHVDLNYPEHFQGLTIDGVGEILYENGLKLNSIAVRFRDAFVDGEFTNHNRDIALEAEALCTQAMQACRKLGGRLITIWQAYDAFDYPFQTDYEKTWKYMKNAFARISDAAAPDLRVSIEYKPYQPRAFSLIPNAATVLLLEEDVGRKNLGVTLDFCHMLMSGENPAYSLAMAAARGKLYGLHLNDGYRLNDDGLMVGSVHPLHTLEFLYFAKRYQYDGVVYFDTFPVRENAAWECRQNLSTMHRMLTRLDEIGMDELARLVERRSADAAALLLGELLG